MAYGISIPGRSVASNYAATFRPVTTAPGFSQVKSDLAANYLMQVPMLRQKMEMDMAKAALSQAASLEGLDRRLDAEKYAVDLAFKQNKRNNTLAMLGQEEQAPYTIPPVSYLNSLTKSDDALIKALREQKAQSGASTQLPAVGGVDFEKWTSPEMIKALGGLSVDEYLKATTTEGQATPAAKVETKGTTFFTTP
tara:strand:+ start:724 stop:1308 length:585 start_codon:yes stop_codon:yes gene_type:complete